MQQFCVQKGVSSLRELLGIGWGTNKRKPGFDSQLLQKPGFNLLKVQTRFTFQSKHSQFIWVARKKNLEARGRAFALTEKPGRTLESMEPLSAATAAAWKSDEAETDHDAMMLWELRQRQPAKECSLKTHEQDVCA